MSQLDLALEAGVSARHLSFIETGRARPSAEMVQQLAEHLGVPLRERNTLLLAAGFAPAYGQRALEEPEMGPVRDAIARLLRAHEPYPAVVVDRHWGIVEANAGLSLLVEGVAPHLLEPPVNALRVSLHPEGMAPRIRNLGEWRAHLLDRLRRVVAATGDERLAALLAEVDGYPQPAASAPPRPPQGAIAVPLRLAAGADELAFISTATTFGTATDVTVSELAIESFFPADEATARTLQRRPRGG